MASDKQVRYVLYLMSQAGYDTKWMGSRHKQLGATSRVRHGRVEDWIAGMNSASMLIDRLKSMAPPREEVTNVGLNPTFVSAGGKKLSTVKRSRIPVVGNLKIPCSRLHANGGKRSSALAEGTAVEASPHTPADPLPRGG
jgi:hypothetical protein